MLTYPNAIIGIKCALPIDIEVSSMSMKLQLKSTRVICEAIYYICISAAVGKKRRQLIEVKVEDTNNLSSQNMICGEG